jgi:hypothetical protein
VLIDGSVNFANNAIALTRWQRMDVGLVLGPSFANVDSSPIALEFGSIGTNPVINNLLPLFDGKTILKPSAEDGVVIASVKNQFELKRLYYGNTSSATVSFFPDDPIEWVIDNDGKLSVSLAQ